ncbi:MAG TPA: LTA synthase family protein [Sphingobacteriaceae bacterium]
MDTIYFEEPEYPFFDKLKKSVAYFVNASLALLISMLVVRVMEVLYISNYNALPKDLGKVVWMSVSYDMLFFVKILPLIYVLFLLVYFSSKDRTIHFWGFGLLGTLFIFIYLVLVKYFATALVPLGADLFGYSIDDIRQTVGAGTLIDIWTVILVIFPLAIFWSLLGVLSKYQVIRPAISLCLLTGGFLLVYLGVSAVPKVTVFKTDFSYNLALNKVAFFTEKSYLYFTDDEPEVDIYAINYIEDEETANVRGFKKFTYLDSNYPFYRKDETSDVLGNFFNINPGAPPNVVFIQVEGLGRAYSGDGAYLGSFTPFLDALASKSLYFKNFLSAQGRTFASLPSILGSLPFADKGFNDLGSGMPDHYSLPQILKKNGYQAKFYSGVDNTFDNQEEFLKKQGFDVLVGEKDYGPAFRKSPANASGFSWGYADRDLMLRTLQLESRYKAEPFLLFLQTISMHTPYTIPDQTHYLEVFEKHMTRLGFDSEKKQLYRQHKSIYSTILYTDEALQFFFKEYSRFPAFKNTIFIITGDHRLPEIPMSTKIDRYHVPLIIYSPLLKRTASFRSISTHFDITPSLLALLRENYSVKSPSEVTWIGSGLDTVRTFRNVHEVALKQTKNDLHNFVSGLYFLDQDILFSISENLELVPAENASKLSELRSSLNHFKAKNNRLSREKRLMPKSLISR